MTFLLVILIVLMMGGYLYLRQPQFGNSPAGSRLERIKRSPHFRHGKFQNLNHTPELTEGYGMMEVMYEFLFKKTSRRKPPGVIPSVKTDLLHLDLNKNLLIWFGHSSYYLQVHGKRMLVDPVFSGNASPIPGSNKSFRGTDIYSVEDLPFIDYLFITHDHYDHADYTTLTKLIPKTGKVICGLGVGAHLERWSYKAEVISETDWYETLELANGFFVHTAPTRHFSGRNFSRCSTLWQSYILQTPSMKIYIGGDSGYDTHFAEIGNKFGPFDLVILDNGQYDKKWKYIHMLPEEVLLAARELKAKKLFPVHSAKFIMANHAWDEPLVRITELNKNSNIPLVTPLIGELVDLKDSSKVFPHWWTEVS